MYLVADADPPLPTYRQLQLGNRPPFAISAIGLFDEPRHLPILLSDGTAFVDGRPYDESRGHFIRVRRSTMPAHVETTYVIGCNVIHSVALVLDGEDPLVPVDERHCRGPFTAFMCEPDRCWVAGWY